MPDAIVVYKGRTNTITVDLGFNASADTFTSEIRTAANVLIATWSVAFTSDGTDGELTLTMDNTITSAITYPSGLMDIKRMSVGEPLPVFDKPLEVEFREAITA